MKDVSNIAGSAASTLLHSGYAVLRMDAGLTERVDAIFDAAYGFFSLEVDEKRLFERPDILEGYRGFGAEHSLSTDRPDLNETFSHAPRNTGRPEVAGWDRTNPLHRALCSAAGGYAALSDAILGHLGRAVAAAPARIHSADFSYFQLNHYRPKRESRDLLQDAHEDGHLLTIATSRQPGLEIEIGGRFENPNLAPNELLVMPGGILTLMTGGAIAPLTHRVRNVPGVERRASLMFFVNPNVTHPPRAWVPAADGSWPDVGRATVESSQAFGLASIEAIAR